MLTLRTQCPAQDLPDPLNSLEIDGTVLPSYVFIHDGPRVFRYYTPKEESVKLFHDYLDLHRSNLDPTFRCCRFRDVRPLTGPRRPRHAAPASVERRAEILRRAVARPRQLRAFLQHRFAAAWPPSTVRINHRAGNWRAWRACTSRVSAPGCGRPEPAGPVRTCSTSWRPKRSEKRSRTKPAARRFRTRKPSRTPSR
ncbi:hypothetical protein J4732_19800 [Serratia marcescens]|uniref:Uncharacterized protein n=1 Tax=Serratia marcescens TaxID=615 RepID=A0A939NMR0_SERMA|nr:hypothetical protein [Serratia marcescens]